MKRTRTCTVSCCLLLLSAVGALAAAPGDVVITEIMYNPNSSESVASNCPLTEWIEIYNTTAADIDMTGWFTADEDGRSGDFPAFTLPANGVAVIVPTGYGTTMLTKAQFTAAWRTPAEKIIQPTSTNDMSRGRSSTSVRGGIVGDGFSNSPTRNDDETDDLVNTPLAPIPCAYGQAFCEAGPPDNEVLLLVDNTNTLIDKVNFDDEFRGWPTDSPDGPSIMLDETKLNASDNDEGANWTRAVVGQRQAKSNAISAPFTGNDIGSPGRLDGITPLENDPPNVTGLSLWTVKGGSRDISLPGNDDGLPVPATLSFVIEALPVGGKLLDLGNAEHEIAPAELPYTLAAQGRSLRYVNQAACGNGSFTFHANDGEHDSTSATVTLNVQCGQIIITEIMYDPASSETTAKVTEWIEVYNPGDQPVDVSNWYLTDASGRSGDWPDGTIIPAGGVAVIVPRGAGTRLMDAAGFVAAWNGYSIAQIIQPETGTGSNDTANGEITSGGLGSTEELRLVDAGGGFQDYASYDDEWPWPVKNGAGSIHLLQDAYHVAANDSGLNWRLSSECAGGAYGSAISGLFNAHDYGSPGYLAGITAPTGTLNLTARTRRVGVMKNTAKAVLLATCGGSGPMTSTVTAVNVANGSLRDPADLHVITAAELPYTLLNGGSTVEYVPNPGFTSVFGSGAGGAGQPNEDSFSFSVTDGVRTSWQDGVITLVVQKGGLVISEIMYNPANNARNDWQYYELYNTTANDIVLKTLTDDNGEPEPNLALNLVIPAGAVRVITTGVNNASRTAADFLAEWDPLTAEATVFVDATLWEKVGNESDRLQLIDAAGDLLDEVYFFSTGAWPVYDDRASIALKTGLINAIDNDDSSSWALSAAGVEGAWATPDAAGDPADSDVGSPGFAPAVCIGEDCLGACCLPGNLCENTAQNACAGVWQGVGTSCATIACPVVCPKPFGDHDFDHDMDQEDFAQFQRCFSTGEPEEAFDTLRCGCFDRSGDGRVGVEDVPFFVACGTGAGVPFDLADPPLGCLP